MSATNTQLRPEDAYNILVAEVHAPVFFNKLASVYNITPQSEEEAHSLLMLAAKLRNAQEQDNTKKAAVRGNFYNEALRDLSNVLGDNTNQFQTSDNVKKAAAVAAQNPLVREAAVVFANYLAQATN